MRVERLGYHGVVLSLALVLALSRLKPADPMRTGVRAPDPAEGYEKFEYRIPMRDGVKLYTAVYVPKGRTGFPILMERTPYGSGPYGKGRFPEFEPLYARAGYAFAFQDVRGTFESEGTFVNIRPELRPGEKGIDESTDTYDTVDWLVKGVKGNNGNVGIRGISYPGFYAAMGALSRHPALKAVSPQAPCSDWFVGDDVHHNGAFFLQDNFDFSALFGFDLPRKGPETDHGGMDIPRPKGAYAFYLDAGTAANLDTRYLKGASPYWNEVIGHDTYDAYWKARSVEPEMTDVRCAVLNVGGLFDAEDMWGALNVYAATERQNPGIDNFLVMGPWSHGQWDGPAPSLAGMRWGSDTGAWYREHVEFPFFERYLHGVGDRVPEATVFETGANRWRTFDEWPPKGLTPSAVYLAGGKGLSPTPAEEGSDAYENDPNAPTPYLADPTENERPGDLLARDEGWAAKRADVLTYVGAPVEGATTLAGPVDVDLWVTTTGTDGDFVVKLLDVAPRGEPHAGEMRAVREDVVRGRFRNSLEKPEAIVPGQPTEIRMRMNAVLHTFKPGHRMAVQVQSSWFPLVDRNPNRFVPNVERAKPDDFQKATVTVLRGGAHASAIRFGVLPEK